MIGIQSWLSFYQMFDSYRSVMNCGEQECRAYLNWSLKSKALDFVTITTTIGENYSFKNIMKKLDSRLRSDESTETARVNSNQAAQMPVESLEDSADKISNNSIS